MYIPVKDTRKSKDPSSNCLHGKNGFLSKPDNYRPGATYFLQASDLLYKYMIGLNKTIRNE